MSKILDSSTMPAMKAEVNLFTVPSTQVAVKRSFWSEVHLQNPCTGEGPWNFHIPKDLYYLQLSKNFLYIKFCIVCTDGMVMLNQPAAEGAATVDIIRPINLIGKTFIKQAKVFING